MKHLIRNILLCTFALACLAATAVAGQTIELRFADGSKWKGTTDTPVVVEFRQGSTDVEIIGRIVRHESLYVVVEGTIGGLPSTVTIFKRDLVSVRNAVKAATGKGA